jgi:hypothetical protein
LVSLLKTCSFTFCLTCICILMQVGESSNYLLLMLSSLCAMPVYCWYWQRSRQHNHFRCCMSVSILLILIGFMNYLFISHLLV